MLVYGDPRFECDLRQLVLSLSQSLQIGTWTDGSARRFLIRCGQMEQGIEDLAHADPSFSGLAGLCRELTDAAAETLLGISESSSSPLLPVLEKITDAANKAEPATLQVKVPEGFEFYSVFPEQYAVAARDWVQAHSQSAKGRVIVLGVRSIGTSLSAVVTNVLQQEGINVARITVRPSGHPFNRSVELKLPSRCTAALVVDEGPGRSGSSMVASLRALRAAGISDVAFLPAHGNLPGPAATPEIQRCWEQTPRFVGALESVSFPGGSLERLLQKESERILRSDTARPLINVGGGAWRQCIEGSQDADVVVIPCLERAKYLWTGRNGARLLWKFEGLGSWKSHNDVGLPEPGEEEVAPDHCVPGVAEINGFCAYPWVKGVRPLHGVLTTEETLQILARYIASRVGLSLPGDEQGRAVRRLGEMASHNAAEWLNGTARERFEGWFRAALQAPPSPVYGDGRMAPWEWVVSALRGLLKTDWRGHVRDHTLIGAQSFFWDIAGAIIEWRLDSAQVVTFLDHCRGAGLPLPGTQAVLEEILRFYLLAYAAFRYGACGMSGERGSAARYAGALAELCHETPG